MANTYTQLYVHIVFHTKSTGVVMRDEDLERIFQYIGGAIRDEGAIPFAVGGVADHVHILTTLPKTKSLADFMRVIKSNTSKWIHRLDSYYDAFRWQDGYGAFSVSPSRMEQTTRYIFTQAQHHRVESYRDEYLGILDSYGIEYDEQRALED